MENIIKGTLNCLQKEGYNLKDKDSMREVCDWINNIPETNMNKFLSCKSPCYSLCCSFLEYKRKLNENPQKYSDMRIKNNFVESQKKITLYDDINKDNISKYESKKIGKITFDNINVTEINIYIDTLFMNNDNYLYSYSLNNREQYSLETKSVPYKLNNIKGIEISNMYIPSPSNIGLSNDIIKMNILEFQDVANREYPNYNYVFEFQVETYGSRYKLTPLKNRYRFGDAITDLNNLSFSFYLQNLRLEFPDTSKVATLNYTNPMQFNSNAHGLLTGDKISIYSFVGSININSTFIVTVINPNLFTIPINATGATGMSNIKYYILKNKIEGNLSLLSL